MPSGKTRSKDDTWKEAELKKALQSDRKKERSDDKSRSRSDRDDDKRRRRREARDDIANGDDKEREHRRREKDSEREKRKDREKEGERSHKEKDIRRDRKRETEFAGETSGIGKEDKESRDREHRRTRDKDSDREKHHRSRREREDPGRHEEKSRDKERTSEKDKERRRRREERESGGQDKSTERRRDSSRERDHRDRRKDRERDDLLKPRDENREKRRERTREKDGRDRRKGHRDDDSRERREKSRDDKDRRRDHDRSRERTRDKSREREERHRRKEKEKLEAEKEKRAQRREKEMLASLQNEEDLRSKGNLAKPERFRADTSESADVIDEEENASGIQRKTSTGQQGLAEEVGEEGEADDYDDDFEDYEDDFDEDDQDEEEEDTANTENRNAGMQELLKAINLENETVRALSREGSKLSKSSDDDSKRDTSSRTPTTTARGRINFVAAKQKQISEKVASRTRKRGQELMHLIDLDVAVFEMFDLPPMNEYDLYIKNFGRSDTTQAYVQCNDDNLEKEVQTDEIETRTMWTQNPAETFTGCGDGDGNQDDLLAIENRPNVDSIRLSRFLESAGQVCLVLLEEASADQSSTMIKEKKEMTCSDGYIPLATKQPFLAGRTIESIHISPVQSHLLLTAYGPVVNQVNSTSTMVCDAIGAKSVVCFWNVNEPSQPQRVLLCESIPRCCCLSPSKATIAFAGLEDGSVVSWDLRESSPVHHTVVIENTTVIFRPPTFSTAGVLSQDNHRSPVVSLRPVVMPGDRSLIQEISSSTLSARASSSLGGGLRADDMVGLSFQLASLEEDAVVNIWVVVELDGGDIAGSESDFGLAPGGKIKLIKSASLTLELPMRGIRKTTALEAFCIRFLPQDPNHFYVGTDSGCVLHRIRHGGRAPPKAYKPQTESLVDVTTIDISPFQLPCILAGSRDGSVRLYHLNNEFPHNTWTSSTNGSPIVTVQWSRSVPNIFYVLDANSVIYIWDLLQNESSPVSMEKPKQGRVACFEISSDYTASGVGVPGRNPEMVLGYENGMVEVHRISPRFSKASPDELDRFHNYLETVM